MYIQTSFCFLLCYQKSKHKTFRKYNCVSEQLITILYKMVNVGKIEVRMHAGSAPSFP